MWRGPSLGNLRGYGVLPRSAWPGLAITAVRDDRAATTGPCTNPQHLTDPNNCNSHGRHAPLAKKHQVQSNCIRRNDGCNSYPSILSAVAVARSFLTIVIVHSVV